MAATRPNPTLSDDLVSEILVRVPVKSLLCFRTVCKTWLSLIKDPAFVKSQQLLDKTDQTLIISHKEPLTYKNFSLLNFDSRQIVADLKFPYPQGEFIYVPCSIIVGSANGIVCVAVNFDTWKFSIYLWNPAIRQSKLIPSPSVDSFSLKGLGFGYDGVDNDFKVVCFFSSPFRAEVYSDNRNAWRNVPEPMDIPSDASFNVCINGILFGIGNYGMMAFNLNQEVLNCAIKLPVIEDAHAHDYYQHEARVIEFNNSIAVIMVMCKTGWCFDKKINMWTCDDDACLRGGGVEASWTPMFSIDLGMAADLIHGCFSNGNLLLLLPINDVYVWVSSNADEKEAKIVPLSVDMAVFLYGREIYKYTESLVSLAGFKHVNWNVGEDNN